MPLFEFCSICYLGPIPSKGDQAKPDGDYDHVTHQPCDLIAESARKRIIKTAHHRSCKIDHNYARGAFLLSVSPLLVGSI